MFFLWLITLIYGISFLNYRNLNAIYFLIVLGIFIVFNVIFYFLIVNNFLNEKQIFLGPILSFLLIVWSIFTLKSSFFEIKFFLTQIGIVIFLALFSFLFTSLTDNFSKILTFFSLLLFLILAWQFEKNIFFETKRKKEIEKILKEQKELLEAKEQFILSIQHHLRTPLGPIREYLNRILQGFYGNLDNPVIKKRLVEVKKLADDVYYLVEQLIEIQRYKTKRDSIKLEKCQIEEIIESVVNELLSSAQDKGLYLEYEKIPLPSVEIDRKKIKEAIFNLVDNAIKYTRTGGVKIKTKIENKKLKIEISDTGIGMEKEEIEKFLKGTLFERGIEAKKMYGSGKGIGLSLAIQFVEAHGGKIFAKSEGFGKGTTFWIELPLK
jgi:signal transduction histidine kinase